MLKYFFLSLLLVSMPVLAQTPEQLSHAGIAQEAQSDNLDEVPLRDDGLIDVEKLSIEQVKQIAADAHTMYEDIFKNENFDRMSEEQQEAAIESFVSKHVVVSVSDIRMVQPSENTVYCTFSIDLVNGTDAYINNISTVLTYGSTRVPFEISQMEPHSQNSAQTSMVGEDCQRTVKEHPIFEVENCSIEGMGTEECRMAVIFM